MDFSSYREMLPEVKAILSSLCKLRSNWLVVSCRDNRLWLLSRNMAWNMCIEYKIRQVRKLGSIEGFVCMLHYPDIIIALTVHEDKCPSE